MQATRKRSTRPAPDHLVSEAEDFFAEVVATMRQLRRRARQIAGSGMPKDAERMMEGEILTTRVVEAWLQLDCFAHDAEIGMKLEVDSESELAERWKDDQVSQKRFRAEREIESLKAKAQELARELQAKIVAQAQSRLSA